VTCANIGFRELVLNPRDAPQTHVWGASLLSEPRRRGRWFSGAARRRSGAAAEEVAEEVAERPSAPTRSGRRGNCGYYQQFPWSGAPVARRRSGVVAEGTKGHNVPLETVYVIHIFPGQTHRWLGVAEGIKPHIVHLEVEWRCRKRRASWIISSLITQRAGIVTGLGITRRSGGRGPLPSASAGESGLVFYNLSLSKARKWGKPDIAERLAEEARPPSGHGQ